MREQTKNTKFSAAGIAAPLHYKFLYPPLPTLRQGPRPKLRSIRLLDQLGLSFTPQYQMSQFTQQSSSDNKSAIMVFSKEDRILIKEMRLSKGYGAKRLLKEFPLKNWSLAGVKRLLKNITATGSSDRKPSSGRPKSCRMDENIAAVEDLVMSQDSQPGTHRSLNEIALEVGVSKATVHRIVHKDLNLKCLKKIQAQELTAANKLTRLVRAKQLLRDYSQANVHFIWFTDEKLFTVAAPKNTQNDRLYVSVETKKKEVRAARLLRTRSTFSKSVMVSVGVSSLGVTELVFIEPGMKINGAYYRDVLLTQHLLLAIREQSSDFFIFQQDSVPASWLGLLDRYLNTISKDINDVDL